jgi:hypothetical protein
LIHRCRNSDLFNSELLLGGLQPPSFKDGKDVPITRAASGLYTWSLPADDNPFGLPAGSYKSATEGLWVYLPDGLEPGNYTIKFGGSYFGGFFVLDITYKLKVE